MNFLNYVLTMDIVDININYSYQAADPTPDITFLRAKAAMFSARLSYRNSVRPSVRPSVRLSVRLSHGWIRQKRSKLGSPNFHHRLPGRL